MPKVSVLMGVYNEKFNQIDLAIKSILTQTFNDYELIIINDNPKDKEMKEFLYHVSPKIIFPCGKARNKGSVRLLHGDKQRIVKAVIMKF